MSWFDGRIDIHFQIYCLNCGHSFYPYCKDWTIGKSPQQVFEILSNKTCPECNETRWGHNL